MKSILVLLVCFGASTAWSQSNLSIFNNNGQQFYVVLNGIRQNSIPQTNVQVAQIKNGNYAVKVIFADGKTADIDKNFMIDAPSDITARIIFKKGKGKLQLMGMEPTNGVLTEAVVYRPSEAAIFSDAVVVNNLNVNEAPNTTTLNTTFQNSNTTINSITSTPDEENVNLNLNVSIEGVNVNLNASASGTSTQIQNQQNFQNNQSAPTQQSTTFSRVNCTQTLDRIEAFKTELQDQTFEDDRLEALKLALKKTCLSSTQAELLMELFTFDENRLEVAKYLAERLTDRENAGVLAKKMTFESNKMEYRRYISE
jgi:hypothetical protein